MQIISFFFLALQHLLFWLRSFQQYIEHNYIVHTYYVRSYNNLVYLHKVVCLFKHFKFAWPIFLSSFDQGLNQQRILGNSGRHKQNAFWDALFLQQRIICEQFKENHYYTISKLQKELFFARLLNMPQSNTYLQLYMYNRIFYCLTKSYGYDMMRFFQALTASATILAHFGMLRT